MGNWGVGWHAKLPKDPRFTAGSPNFLSVFMTDIESWLSQRLSHAELPAYLVTFLWKTAKAETSFRTLPCTE